MGAENLYRAPKPYGKDLVAALRAQVCNELTDEAADRIQELENILAPIQQSKDKAEALGRKVEEWIAYAKQLEIDSSGAVGQENARLRERVKDLEYAISKGETK